MLVVKVQGGRVALFPGMVIDSERNLRIGCIEDGTSVFKTIGELIGNIS
ncbi:MAG: hypothetical protein LUD15_11035 [Bacteroides sp.]|nr:hypothetical protein [Bacteroides sp.]